MKKEHKKIISSPKNQKLKKQKPLKIKIIGIGGGGSSIIKEVKNLIPNFKQVSFVAANVDSQAINSIGQGIKKFQFGGSITYGLGCGMNADLGRKAAEASIEEIKREIKNVDLVIIISCLGGGAGSGASPVFAKIAKNNRKVVLGIFTLPFKFEKDKRTKIALKALDELKPNLNALLVIPNNRIFKVIDLKTPLKKAFSIINSNLAQTLGYLIDIIYKPGLINIDFADLKTILEGKGKIVYLNSAVATGANRAQEVLKKVLYSPLSKYNISAQGRKNGEETFNIERILFNIGGPADLKMSEVEYISRGITDLHKKSKIIFGVSKAKDKIRDIKLTLLAIGSKEDVSRQINKEKEENKKPLKKRAKEIKKRKIKLAPKKKKEIFEDSKQRQTVRRSALEVQSREKKEEREILKEEEKWDVPAFLRQKGKLIHKRKAA